MRSLRLRLRRGGRTSGNSMRSLHSIINGSSSHLRLRSYSRKKKINNQHIGESRKLDKKEAAAMAALTTASGGIDYEPIQHGEQDECNNNRLKSFDISENDLNRIFGNLVSCEEEKEFCNHHHQQQEQQQREFDDTDDDEYGWTSRINALGSSGDLMEDLSDDIIHNDDDAESTVSIKTVMNSEHSITATVMDGIDDEANNMAKIFCAPIGTEHVTCKSHELKERVDDDNAGICDGTDGAFDSKDFVIFDNEYSCNAPMHGECGSTNSSTSVGYDKNKGPHKTIRRNSKGPNTSKINPMIGEKSTTDDVKDRRKSKISERKRELLNIASYNKNPVTAHCDSVDPSSSCQMLKHSKLKAYHERITNYDREAKLQKHCVRKFTSLKNESEHQCSFFRCKSANPPQRILLNKTLPRRIAKNFICRNTPDGPLLSKMFFGTVVSMDFNYKANEPVWHVIWDDGDEEEFEKFEFIDAAEQYERLRSLNALVR